LLGTLLSAEGVARAQVNGDAQANAPAASPPTFSPAPSSCIPGQQIACGCSGSAIGVQRCEDDGRRYGECTKCALPELRAPTSTPSPAATGQVGSTTPTGTPWGLYLAAGAAIDHPAVAFSVGARYRFSDSWHGGVDGEWNPWFSYETKRAKSGTANLYATLVRRFAVSDVFHLRTTLHLGASALLFDLYGAPAGTFGPYLGVNLIGLEWKLTRSVHLIIEPGDVAISVPHLTGAPLSYRQYRFTVGVQFSD
jgi:hypothetical protein